MPKNHRTMLGDSFSGRCFLDNSSLLVAEADNDEWEYHGNTQPWPGIWTILAVLTLQPWLWGATVLTTTIAILLAILLRLQPRRKKRLAYVALRICKRRYAHKATQESRFHGGAGGSRTTMRKRQQEQRNTNDIEDADTVAAALIALATAFQQRRLHQQPPHTRQTTSMQPDRQQPRPPRNNQKTTVAPKLDLYASIHRIFQDKTQDPLPALMTLLTQAQEIRQARHDKRSMKTTAEQPTTPATTTNDSTRSLPILKNQTSSPTTTGEQPPRLTFDTKTPVMSGQRLIELLEDNTKLRDGYAMVTTEECHFIQQWIKAQTHTNKNTPTVTKGLVIWDKPITAEKPQEATTTWLPTNNGYKQFFMVPLYNDMPAPLPEPRCIKATATTEPIPTDDDNITIRIETYEHLNTPAEWTKRLKQPASMLQATLAELNLEAHTFGWRITQQQRTTQLTGYIRIKPKYVEQITQRSGEHGIIYTQVGASKDSVQWIPKETYETDITYFQRVTELPTKKNMASPTDKFWGMHILASVEELQQPKPQLATQQKAPPNTGDPAPSKLG